MALRPSINQQIFALIVFAPSNWSGFDTLILSIYLTTLIILQ